MSAQSLDDVRFHDDAVSRVVRPWTHPDPEELRGRFVVVSGPRGSGRSTVLAQVADDLHHAGIPAVQFVGRDNALRRAAEEPGSADRVVQGLKVLAAALQVLGPALAGNLLALGTEVATTHLMNKGPDVPAESVNPYLHVAQVEAAIRRRAENGPVALVIDDADRLDAAVWWDVLFSKILVRLTEDMSVLVVLGVERSSPAASSPAIQVIDDHLLPDRVAQEVRLGPMDRDRIARCLQPIDDDLVDHLRALVQGQPAWLDELWREWCAEAVVVWRDDRWSVAPDAESRVRASLRSRVELALHVGARGGSDEYERAREVVRTAALEGQRFTAEALAAVLDEDVEDLINWFDDHLATPQGLVEDDGFVGRSAGVEPPELRCYRFRSALVAGVLRQDVLAQTNGKVLAGRYAHALAAVYRWSPAISSASTIARLAMAAGDRELVETTWRRAKRLEHVAAAAMLGRFLVAQLDAGDLKPGELLMTARRLVDVSQVLSRSWDLAETLRIARAAEGAARALGQDRALNPATDEQTELLIRALEFVGAVAFDLGQFDEAILSIQEAAQLSAPRSDYGRTAELYRRLAQAFLTDEMQATNSEYQQIAVGHAVAALGWAERLPHSKKEETQAWCQVTLSRALADGQDFHGAAKSLRKAVNMLVSPAFKYRLMATELPSGCLLAAIELAMRRKEFSTLKSLLSASLRCRQKPVNCCFDLFNLGWTCWHLADIPAAAQAAAQCLRLSQELKAPMEERVLQLLAACAASAELPLAPTFAVLASDRTESTHMEVIEELWASFEPFSKGVDESTRRRIEQDYRVDRGAALLREAFGIEVSQIDALNERLGTAEDAELRELVHEVQRYCASVMAGFTDHQADP